MQNIGMHDAANWGKTREKIKAGQLAFDWGTSSCAGVHVMEVMANTKPEFPYGWVWFRFETGNVIAIMQSYVQAELRRCGLRKAMHEHLLESYPNTRMIVTGRATELALPFLKKAGFKFNKDFDRWELLIEKPVKKGKA